ncbi:hypothetical protein ACUH6D_001720 [Yersinia enterocolitica]
MLSKAELNLSTDALTVEQAIEHALAVYEQNDCNMFGRQHKQLAIWLTELLSLREQLAELKALPPVAVVELNDNLTVAEIRGDIPRRKAVRELYEGALVIGQELFTAAKPAED